MAAELSLRFIEVIRPSYTEEVIREVANSDGAWSVPDPILGVRGIPARSQQVQNRDYAYRVENDHLGFPNAEPWPEKVDLVFLGDSLLIGSGIGRERSFPALVGQALPDLGVVNLGLPGASPEHQLRIFERFVSPFRPRIVLACLWVASDIENGRVFEAWLATDRSRGYEEFRREVYPELQREQAASIPSPPFRLKRFLWSLPYQTFLMREARYLLEPWQRGLVHEVTWQDGSRLVLERRKQLYLAETSIEGEAGAGIREVFFGPLEQLRRSVADSGGQMVVVLIPSKEELFAAPDGPRVLRLVSQVRSQLTTMDLPVIDLYDPIRKEGERSAPYFPYDIHLNERGSRAAAAAIEAWLERR